MTLGRPRGRERLPPQRRRGRAPVQAPRLVISSKARKRSDGSASPASARAATARSAARLGESSATQGGEHPPAELGRAETGDPSARGRRARGSRASARSDQGPPRAWSRSPSIDAPAGDRRIGTDRPGSRAGPGAAPPSRARRPGSAAARVAGVGRSEERADLGRGRRRARHVGPAGRGGLGERVEAAGRRRSRSGRISGDDFERGRGSSPARAARPGAGDQDARTRSCSRPGLDLARLSNRSIDQRPDRTAAGPSLRRIRGRRSADEEVARRRRTSPQRVRGSSQYGWRDQRVIGLPEGVVEELVDRHGPGRRSATSSGPGLGGDGPGRWTASPGGPEGSLVRRGHAVEAEPGRTGRRPAPEQC